MKGLGKKAINSALKSISPENNQAHFDDIIDFIGNVAQSEQAKELSSIENYCKDMQAIFNEEMQKEFNISDILNPNYIKENPIEFQNRFIIAFDAARRGINETIATIKKTKQALDSQAKFGDLTKTNYLFRAQNDLKTTIETILGKRTQAQLTSNSLTSRISGYVMNTLELSGIIDRIKNGEKFVKISTGIQVDLMKRIQAHFNEHDEYKDLVDIPDADIQEIVKRYSQEIRENSPVSQYQKALVAYFSGDGAALDPALDSAGKILKIKTKPFSKSQRKELIDEADKIQKSQEETIRQQCFNFPKQLEVNQELLNSLYDIDFNIAIDSKGVAGDIYEYIQSIDFGAQKVRANVATDLVSFHIDCTVKTNLSGINNYLSRTAEALSTIGDSLAGSNHDINMLSNKIIEANNELTNIIHDLEQDTELMDKLDKNKLFIQQETLKLHSSAGKNGQGFEGRTMVITSYISYLASMNGVHDKLDLNQDALELLSYSLIDGGALQMNEALEGKEKLEQYFSLFSAMLMFDDVRNMAADAAQMIANSNQINGQVQTLHIYNLNGTYVPASVILNTMYQSLIKQQGMFSASQSARATIEYKNKPPKSISDIQVKITLLSGYQELIKQLTNQLE